MVLPVEINQDQSRTILVLIISGEQSIKLQNSIIVKQHHCYQLWFHICLESVQWIPNNLLKHNRQPNSKLSRVPGLLWCQNSCGNIQSSPRRWQCLFRTSVVVPHREYLILWQPWNWHWFKNLCVSPWRTQGSGSGRAELHRSCPFLLSSLPHHASSLPSFHPLPPPQPQIALSPPIPMPPLTSLLPGYPDNC